MAYISFKPSDHFNTKLYSGNGSTNAQTGVGFQPGWIWIKNRDGGGGSHDHYVFDQVRGTTKYLRPNETNGQGTASGVTSFDSDGFTLGSSDGMNENGRTFVSWNWKANGQGSSNTDGSINTLYTSANTTSGFSVSTWNGTGSNGTIGHGLGKVPKMLIIKRTDGTQAWMVYHTAPGNNSEGQITTSAFSASSTAWQDTDPTSSVFYVSGSAGDSVNASGYAYVGYAFAEVKGFSKIGKYVGNGSADGPFIYTGFKPAFVMFKNYQSNGDNWVIQDNKREGFNPNNRRIFPNDSAEENTSAFRIDMVSNGFKLVSSDSDANASENFLYMAFAEEPLVSSNNIPATAR
jgi:hypothetical protein